MKGVLIAFILLLLGPGEPGRTSVASPDQATPLAGTRWLLESYGPTDAPTSVIEGSKVTLMFEEAGQVGGSGGCNAYGGRYQVDKSAIRFKDIVSTLMACADERVTHQEGLYLRALESATGFELSQDKLTISYHEGRSVLCFIRTLNDRARPQPTSPQYDDQAI
jgi:heat shock protein HslJ